MVTILFIIVFLLWTALTSYLLRFKIRRWWRGNKVVHPNLTPHERWPEILHWQKDDIFDCCGSMVVDEPAPELIAISPDGYAYCWANCLHDNKVCIPIRHLIGRNETLLTRRIDSELHSETDEYMELIKQFNVAYKELQDRDKRNGIAA